MKSATHPFHHRSKLGYYYEMVLKPALETDMGRCLTKTSEETDTMDFVGKNCFVELKTRSDQFHYNLWYIKKDGWILPTCKIRRAIDEYHRGNEVVFYYFWKADKTLWRWNFHPEHLNEIQNKYPEWHLDKQEQSYVPESFWTMVKDLRKRY